MVSGMMKKDVSVCGEKLNEKLRTINSLCYESVVLYCTNCALLCFA